MNRIRSKSAFLSCYGNHKRRYEINHVILAIFKKDYWTNLSETFGNVLKSFDDPQITLNQVLMLSVGDHLTIFLLFLYKIFG